MATITEVTFGSHDTCPACGHVHPPQVKGELIRIHCDNCGESLLYFGSERTYEADLQVEAHEDGSATITMIP